MTRIVYLLLSLCLASCGGNPPAPKQPITHSGQGFHCTGNLCLRTELACKTVQGKNGSSACIRSSTAQCFTLQDDDNMRYWMVCLDNAADCQAEREASKERNPNYLRFTPCRVTR